MYVVELLLVSVSTCGGPNYVPLIEAVSYSSTYVSLVYGADSINGNIYVGLFLKPQKRKKTPQQQPILGIKDSLETAKLPMEL
jgi:hypothetical protein